MLESVFDEIMENPLGGDINSDACEFEKNSVVLHCWDGRRYFLSCVQTESGCGYDSTTGEPVENYEFLMKAVLHLEKQRIK